MKKLSHLDEKGAAVMVDVSGKRRTLRHAVAEGVVAMSAATFRIVMEQGVKKGDVLGAARIAGIMAAKKTPELIPLCHPLFIDSVSIHFDPAPEQNEIRVTCAVRVADKTGVEMEAMTGVSVACLTIYDMCKAVDKSMEIRSIRLLRKSGGKSGTYVRRT